MGVNLHGLGGEEKEKLLRVFEYLINR